MLLPMFSRSSRPTGEALPVVSGDGPRSGLVGFAGACLVLFQAWLHHRPTSQLFAVSRHDASRHASPPSPVLQAVLLPLLPTFQETTSRHDPLPSPNITTNPLSHTPRFLLPPTTLSNTTNKKPPSPLHNPRRDHGLGRRLPRLPQQGQPRPLGRSRRRRHRNDGQLRPLYNHIRRRRGPPRPAGSDTARRPRLRQRRGRAVLPRGAQV